MNVVVLIYSAEDRKRLREYIDRGSCTVSSTYDRADWQNQPKGKPLHAIVLRCKDKKQAFEIRMKFDTLPYKGVEF